MRARLMLAPRWVLALWFGLTFGGFMGVFFGISNGSVVAGLVSGTFAGAFFSAVMTRFTGRVRDRMLAQLGNMTPERYSAASRASWRGPVPSDPDQRREALVLAREGLTQAQRFRWLGLVMCGLFLLGEAALLATGDLSTSWTIPVLVAFTAFYASWPGHMRKRVAILKGS